MFVEFDEIADEYGMDFDETEASLAFDRTDADMIRRQLESGVERRVTSNHR